MTTERIFIIGGTGNIGTSLVNELLSKENTQLTLYARNPAKVQSLFPSGESKINVVEGDLNNLDGIKDAFKGHTRLFLLVNALALNLEHIKKTVATYAYEAGVKQIVDISSVTAGYAWKTNVIGDTHARAERAMDTIPHRGKLVALRPGRFMSNMIMFDRIYDGVIYDTYDPEEYLGWISPNDIAAVAAAILTEEIEKHDDAVYELIGVRVTPNQRAEMLSRVLDKKITYQQVPALDRYNQLRKIGFAHLTAFEFSSKTATSPPDGRVTDGFHILIGRGPETLEEYSIKNKDLL